MSYMEMYRTMLANRGATGHDREVNILKRDFERLAPNSAAYKQIIVDGESQNVIVKSSDSYYIREIVCMPGERLLLGKVVQFCDMPWIVTDRDYDEEVYGKSKIKMCNVKLKWKDANDIVHVYDGWADDATKYSEGVEHTSYIRIGEFQLKVFVPVDEYTSTIWRDMRFIIDAGKYIPDIISNNHYPFVFKVTRRNIVTGTYADEGYVEITLVEDEFLVGQDDAENMIAAQINGAKNMEFPDTSEGGWL